MRGPEQSGLLHQARSGRVAERVAIVVVADQLAVGAGPAGAVLPLRPTHDVLIGWDRAEGLYGPRARLAGDLLTQLVTTGVSRVGTVVQPRGPLLGKVGGDEVAHAGDVGGEPAGVGVADPRVQHLRG